MNYWRTAWKRWLVWLAIVSTFAVACVALSEWQFDRRNLKVAEIALVQKNYDAPAVSISSLLPLSELAAENKWRSVIVSGHFMPEKSVLVRNRPNNGQPGFKQVVPFGFDGGVILVDRGWLPTGSGGDLPDLNPLPTSAATSIVVHLLPSETDSHRGAPTGQLADFNLSKAAGAIGIEVDRYWYGTISGAQTATWPKPASKPSLDEGNHLSYALQWIVFALMAFGFLGYVIRKEWFASKVASGFATTRLKKRTRSEADNDIEDGLTRAK